MYKIAVLGLVLGLLALSGSLLEVMASTTRWVPAMEDTGFEYLHDASVRLRDSLRTAREHLDAERQAEARTDIEAALDAVNILLYFDIPITEARQLIYDASRLHALERNRACLEHVDRAEAVMKEIAQHGNASIREVMLKPLTMLEELRLLLTEDKSQVPVAMIDVKFQELSHKLNLMALKSDMILSGAAFTNDRQDH